MRSYHSLMVCIQMCLEGDEREMSETRMRKQSRDSLTVDLSLISKEAERNFKQNSELVQELWFDPYCDQYV